MNRTQDMMHAVDGWKCVMRFDLTALCRRDKLCNKLTIKGGQYEAMSGPSASVTRGRWSLREEPREGVVAQDAVDTADMVCAWRDG